MKRFLLLSVFVFAGHLVFAQGFNQAAGIRGGLTSGLEYRYYTSDMHSFKALLGTRGFGDERGVQFHILTEFYQYDLFEFSYQLVFYYGFGAHAGYESWDVIRTAQNVNIQDTETAFVAGIDGLVGVEYLFYEAPVTAGIEVKPYFDFWGREGLRMQPFDFAFTIKYLF
ncbi:MAG TPA: hypothetical protein VJ919_11030 [Tangfeifania sp.]|nr:hypothetical protein [Tangfeifania sp.]